MPGSKFIVIRIGKRRWMFARKTGEVSGTPIYGMLSFTHPACDVKQKLKEYVDAHEDHKYGIPESLVGTYYQDPLDEKREDAPSS